MPVENNNVVNAQAAFQQFRNQLSRFIARRLDNPAEAEDLLQNVFVRVIRHENALENAKSPLAWLYTVTKSVIADHYRKQDKSPLHFADDQGMDDIPAPAAFTDSALGNCIPALVDILPDKYRDAIRFVDIQGGRQVDYARLADIPVATAKSRVQRGRNILKIKLLNCCRVEFKNNDNRIDLIRKGNGRIKDC